MERFRLSSLIKDVEMGGDIDVVIAADAQATVEALQAQLVTLKRHAGLDCGDQSCLYTLAHSGMRTNGGCRCSPKRMKDDLERSRKAVEALQRERDEARKVKADYDRWLSKGVYFTTDEYAAHVAKHQIALDAERQRTRTATQLIVETIGATGPEDLESALGRMVAQLDAEREKVENLEHKIQSRGGLALIDDARAKAGLYDQLETQLTQIKALVRAYLEARKSIDSDLAEQARENLKRTLDATTPAGGG